MESRHLGGALGERASCPLENCGYCRERLLYRKMTVMPLEHERRRFPPTLERCHPDGKAEETDGIPVTPVARTTASPFSGFSGTAPSIATVRPSKEKAFVEASTPVVPPRAIRLLLHFFKCPNCAKLGFHYT